jgi:GTP-binding protein
MSAKTLAIAKEADIIVFILDAKAGVTLGDVYFSNRIRKFGKRVILAVNKSENMIDYHGSTGEFFTLGLGMATPIAAAHNQGVRDLLAKIKEAIVAITAKKNLPADQLIPHDDSLDDDDIEKILDSESRLDEDEDLSVRIAIIGRPNVGKSTLVNRLLGQDRMLTGDEAGITRDAVDTDFTYQERTVKLIDTAGMRRRARIDEEIEKFSVARSVEAIKNCDVCVLVFDAAAELDKQDLAIANIAVKHGKGLVFAANKIDLASDKKALMLDLKERLAYSFAQIKNVPLVSLSAKKDHGIKGLMAECFDVYDRRATRIGTGRLNKWLETAITRNPPPLSRLKRPTSIKYAMQSAVKPPTFILFAGGATELSDSYKRYLINSLSEAFGFAKIPVRLFIKNGKNPYKT